MRKLIYLFTLLLLANLSFAQQKQVAGTVPSKATGAALQGVTVQSGNNITATDATGKYLIAAAVGQPLKFSFTGLKPVTVNYDGNSLVMDIQMQEDIQNLEEVVVTGYTTEKKKDLKGAVTVVKMGDALKETNSNVLKS